MVTSKKAIGGLIVLVISCVLLFFKNSGIGYTLPSSTTWEYNYLMSAYYLQMILIPMALFGGILLLRDRVGGAKIAIILGFILLGFAIVDIILLNTSVSYSLTFTEYSWFLIHMVIRLCLFPGLIILGGFIGLGDE